jgi:hypothetical protein
MYVLGEREGLWPRSSQLGRLSMGLANTDFRVKALITMTGARRLCCHTALRPICETLQIVARLPLHSSMTGRSITHASFLWRET